MGDAVVAIIQWVVKLGFFSFAAALWVGLSALIVSYMINPIDQSVMGDIGGLVQAWAPFHVASLVSWVTVTVVAYCIYRLAIITYNLVGSFINN